MQMNGHGMTGRCSGATEKHNLLSGVTLSEAQRSMVDEHIRIAGFAASKAVARWGIDPEEAFASASFGLIKAVVGFDSSKGFAFSTYAVQCCMRTIHRDLIRKSNAFKEAPQKQRGKRKYRRRDAVRVLSTDEEDPEMRFTLGQMLEQRREGQPDRRAIEAETIEAARRLLDRYADENTRAADILRMRASGMTLAEVGAAMGVTRERIRQIEAATVFGDSDDRSGTARGRRSEIWG